jgi:prepilin-type processing-associated H-X9-DG protein
MTPVMGTAEPAPGNYSANIGWPRQCTGIDGQRPPLTKLNGALGVINPKSPDPWQNGRVAFASFKDGLSNTVAVSERLISGAVTYQDMAGTPVALHSFCGGGGASRSLPRWERFCNAVTYPDPLFSRTLGRAWISGWTLVGNTYMHVMPINKRHCHIYGGEDDGTNLVTPGSHHPGGVNVLLGDGAVTFINDSIDQVIWWQVGSRDGGEPMTQGL